MSLKNQENLHKKWLPKLQIKNLNIQFCSFRAKISKITAKASANKQKRRVTTYKHNYGTNELLNRLHGKMSHEFESAHLATSPK